MALKGCFHFQFLRDLQRNIHSENNLHTAIHWIQCCLILHNIIIRLEEAHGWNEGNGTVEWACQQGRGMVDEEFEAPDGNEVLVTGCMRAHQVRLAI